MLQTNLQHVNTEEETRQLIAQNRYVMICCGRMGPMCVPVYNIMHQLESEYPNVVFGDMDFDVPGADFITMLPECRTFMGLPFTIYYKDGKVAQATSSIQTREQIVRILDQEFAEGQNE